MALAAITSAAVVLPAASGVAVLPAVAAPSAVRAEAVDLEITRREVVAGGHEFGSAGAYEKLVGTMSVAVDPDDPRNAVIVDLDKAPRNADGLVEYDTDFYLLLPADMDKWNGKLFFEVNNRGNKRTFNYVASSAVPLAVLNDPTELEDFGNGFLLDKGYAIAWAGWEGDVLPGADRMTIRLPVPTEADGSAITDRILVEFHERNFKPDGSTECLPLSGSASFASYPAVAGGDAALRVRPSDSPRPPAPSIPDGTLVPEAEWELRGDSEICVAGGFRPGNVYELFYTARDPRVMALGYAATRDVVSFLRHADVDADGDANPLAEGDGVTAVLGQGISSSGMYMRDFIYQGFNEDLAGRAVFDAVNIHIPGAHKLFLNYRFSQPNPFSTQHRDRYMPYVNFPFNYGVRQDPISGSVDGILKRPETDPLVIHTDTSTEYWQFQAGLINTDGFGNDVALPETVRQYLISGTQHAVTPGSPPALGICQQLSNPTHVGPALRALISSLDAWVVDGTPPPNSRRPTVADGTLVSSDQDATGFPAIPGVGYNGLYNDAGERDRGDRVSGNAGIIDNWRNPPVLADYSVLVPRVDEVGIDLGGVEVPEVGVPTATLTGWNLRRAPFAEGDLCGLSGMSVPLPETDEQARRAGDPRPSLQALYGDQSGYEQALREHVAELVEDGLLLPQDAVVARSIDDSCPEGRVPDSGRTDADGNFHERAIDCMLWWEIAAGTSATSYAPGREVTREQMASFVARLIDKSGGELPDSASNPYSDPGSPEHQDAINKLTAAGVVSGKGDGRFAPYEPVTRGQMATFLVNAYEHVSDRTLTADRDYFTDDSASVHENEINKSAAAGFTSGRNGGYNPTANVLRDQMASFLARTLDLLIEEGTSQPHP